MINMVGKGARSTVLALALASGAPPAGAWGNHALGTWQALASMPQVTQPGGVRAETLESFLQAEARALEPLLQQEELWARAHVPHYPARPAALAFRAAAGGASLRQRFVAALRINPNARLNLALQLRPGAELAGKTLLAWTDVTTLHHAPAVRNAAFQALREGEQVAVLDVLASASDEPDYGLDLGLWDSSGTAYGRSYGFGKEPFGNPALEYASQAPFHMGFFHEAAIVYKAAPFLLNTFPEYRVHLYQSLAAHALRSGHPYWGWRFAGWAMHYVQDLTQPYHTSVLPGVGVRRMLWINVLDLAGLHASKRDVITLVSNRHAALENYQYARMRAAYLRGDDNDALLRGARDSSSDAALAPFTLAALRASISAQSNGAADAVDATLEQTLPRKYISDPAYVFGETEPEIDLNALLAKSAPQAQSRMGALLAGLMRNFGAQSRALLRALPVAAPERTR